LGSSTTAARGTYNWIAELKKRPQSCFQFVNLGVGGDLSFNTRSRVAHAIEARPDRVIVLIGANDILASVFPTSVASQGGSGDCRRSRRRELSGPTSSISHDAYATRRAPGSR